MSERNPFAFVRQHGTRWDLIAIVIASVAAWLTWELVLRDEVKPSPAPVNTPGSSGSGSNGSAH